MYLYFLLHVLIPKFVEYYGKTIVFVPTIILVQFHYRHCMLVDEWLRLQELVLQQDKTVYTSNKHLIRLKETKAEENVFAIETSRVFSR